MPLDKRGKPRLTHLAPRQASFGTRSIVLVFGANADVAGRAAGAFRAAFRKPIAIQEVDLFFAAYHGRRGGDGSVTP